MPQRNLVEPSSLRRSPRFLHFKHSPTTRKSNNPETRSSNFGKTSKNLKKSDNESKIFGKSANGSKIFGKSTNGSRKTTRLSEKIEDQRRSPRFCNEVNSSINLHKSFNGNTQCIAKSKEELNMLGKDSTTMVDVVDNPVTPIGVDVKKSMRAIGKDNGTDTSYSCSTISVNFERRITRSCSRLARSKVEVEKISKKALIGRNLFEHNVCESEGRKLKSSVKVISCSKGKENIGKVEVAKFSENTEKGRSLFKHKTCESKGKKLRSSVKLISCSKGKEKRSDTCNNYDLDFVTEGSDLCKGFVGVLDRRITRSASKQVRGENNAHCQIIVDRRITRSASKQLGRESNPHCQTMQKRNTHGASKQVVRKATINTRDIDVGGQENHKCVDIDIDKLEKETSDPLLLCDIPGKGERNKHDFSMDTKLTGVKRKRKQTVLQGGTNQGWTKEQELELHRAYFTAKPSPHFWKRVAKMVPGKSSQECFDKVHSENQTPLYTKPSSKAKKISPFSGVELFNSAKKNSKKTSKTKCKSHVGRKTVRHLLQKYCHVNQDSETDLFSILEPSVNPSVEDFTLTPKHLMRSPDSSSKSCNGVSSGHKKCLSRLNGKGESPLTSPPVLKKVKNMVLHEKYIDQLHTREHKRKVAFSRCMKSAQNQKNGQENSVHLKDIIKTAKEALVSEAKDVINKYRHSQANIMEEFSDSEELSSDNDEHETVSDF
ncbi:Mis18-binding protein 1 [Bienertia sinuspersici]